MKKSKLALLIAATSGFAASANAALPSEVTTAVTEYKTDALAALGMIIAAGVVIWGLRKLGAKMGWL